MNSRSPNRLTAAPPPAIVKVGGGLLGEGTALREVAAALGRLQHLRLLIVPGGGPFADTVRELDRTLPLTPTTAHWMAILAMDQYAHLLADQLSAAALVDDPAGIVEACDAGRLPVLAPYRWLRAADPMPHSWGVTSDSIAAWVAGQLGSRCLVLIKPAAADPAHAVDAYFQAALPRGVRWGVVRTSELGALGALVGA